MIFFFIFCYLMRKKTYIYILFFAFCFFFPKEHVEMLANCYVYESVYSEIGKQVQLGRPGL